MKRISGILAGAVFGAGTLIASPASAIVTFQVTGQFLEGVSALEQSIGITNLNPRFSKGLLLTIGMSGSKIFGDVTKKYKFFPSATGGPTRAVQYWGNPTSTESILQSDLSIPYDEQRWDDDPTYPQWYEQAGDKILIVFDWGVVPDALNIPLAGAFKIARTTDFFPLALADSSWFDPVDYTGAYDYTPASSVTNGSVSCTYSRGQETQTSSSPSVGFSPATYESSLTSSCNLAINMKAFLPAVPADEPSTSSVPEPATWATIVGGLGLVGGRRTARSPI